MTGDWNKLKVPELTAILTVVQADTKGSKPVLVAPCQETAILEAIMQRVASVVDASEQLNFSDDNDN